MGILYAVTDFDNTVTEERGLEPFFEAYSDSFCKQFGLDRSAYQQVVDSVRNQVIQDQSRFAWHSNGFFSAPIKGDPIGTNTVVHEEIMRRHVDGTLEGITLVNGPSNETELLAVREECYMAAYGKRQTFFRQGAAEYLATLSELFPGHAAIMSNSRASSIERKLAALEGYDVDTLPIIGEATKMQVASTKDAQQPDGFLYQVNPDRPVYINNLKSRHGDLTTLAVVGDNFYLDLAAVLLNDGFGILLETEATQGFEVDWLRSHPKGYFAKNYDSAIDFLRKNK